MDRWTGMRVHRRRPRVLTWPVHGSYLTLLAAADVDWHVVADDGLDGYPRNLRPVPTDALTDLEADAVVIQSHEHWHRRDEILPRHLRALPTVVVEHDPPREHPTDTRHPAADSDVTLVHVTHYNALMWDGGSTPSVVIEHGVADPGVRWDGSLERGIVVVNGLHWRGRRLGRDLFETLRESLPLDLIGMESDALGGLGEVAPPDLPTFLARYRFFLAPMRYTSLGLAILEAMAVGLPVVGLRTTELPRLIRDGENGFLASNAEELALHARRLLDDPELARRVGAAGRRTVLERHGLDRFAAAWTKLFMAVAAGGRREI